MPGDDFCYLTTIGRRSGQPHEIEIWYATGDDSRRLYLLAGAGDSSDWVRNLRADPSCTVRIGERDAPEQPAQGRVLDADDEESRLARSVVFTKYQARYEGDLTNWREGALPVAVDLA